MTAAVVLPSWWDLAEWTATFVALVAVCTFAAWLWLGWTGRKWNR